MTAPSVWSNVLFQCRYRHSAHVAHCEESGNLNAQGEPFDVAVKFPREKESSLQCRVHEIMLFDRNENSLETHDDLQFVGTSLAVRAQMAQARDFDMGRSKSTGHSKGSRTIS